MSEPTEIRDVIAEAVFYSQWGYYGHAWEDSLQSPGATSDLGTVTASYRIADDVLAALTANAITPIFGVVDADTLGPAPA